MCGCFDPGWRASGSPLSLKAWMALRAVLRIAAQLVSYLVGIFAPVAGEQDLATAQGEGIRRTQACLQGLTLGVAQWTHNDWAFHALEDNLQLPSCLGIH